MRVQLGRPDLSATHEPSGDIVALHTWRTLRTKTGATDDAFGGATHPSSAHRVASSVGPLRAVYVYVRPLDTNGDRIAIASSVTETFTIQGVKIVDLDTDGTIDATDDAVLTAELTSQHYWYEIRIPMGGALVWGVQFTDMQVPTGATQYEVRYREEPLMNNSET